MERNAHDLPAVRQGALVGRAGALGLLTGLLTDDGVRLVTLLGPGGIGKTRLALAAAAAVEDAFDEPAVLVDLAPLADPALVARTVAAALAPQPRPDDGVTSWDDAPDTHRLVVLDNAEHLRDEVAAVVDALLAATTRLTVLCTSRVPLGAGAEHRFVVPPLTVPGPATATGELGDVAAVELFTQRARAADAMFAPTPATLRDIARLVRELDGIPLAIELAAAQLAVFTPAQLSRRLEARRSLPPVGPLDPADVPPRHRTLEAAFRWSYDRLPEDARTVFRAVSLLAGAWPLEAAVALSGLDADEDEHLALVRSLVHVSLLQVDHGDEVPLFRMLQTVRRFGLDLLATRADADEVSRRHAAWVLALAAPPAQVPGDAGTAAAQARVEDWAGRLERRHDDVRLALGWLLRHDPVAAGRLATAAAPFWNMKGHVTEGRRRLDDVLAVVPEGEAALRAGLLWHAGELALWQGQAARGRALHEQQLAIEVELGDERGLALAFANLGAAAVILGDYAAAERHLAAADEHARTVADPQLTAQVLRNRAWLRHLEGDLVTALAEHERLADLLARLDDCRDLAIVLTSWALVQWDLGRPHDAERLLVRALDLAERLGDGRGVAFAAEAVAFVTADRADPALLLHVLAATDVRFESAGVPRDPARHRARTDLLDALRPRVGDRWDDLWTAGRRLDLPELVALARSALTRPTAPPPVAADGNPLTEREREVLTLVAQGMPTKRIARTLGIAERTVKAHLTASFAKLGAYSRGHAALLARERGWIDTATPV